jgi:septum formation protein
VVISNPQRKLALASNSVARRRLLEIARLDFEVVIGEVDERGVERDFFGQGGEAKNLSAALARAKALAASRARPGVECLAADQVLILEGEVLHKPASVDDARDHILRLSGRTHILSSAFAIARDGVVRHEEVDCAELTMRNLSEAQVDLYLRYAGNEAINSVGAYQIEGFGIHLFERIKGDQSTIMGLPMLKVLAWLRRDGLVLL